MKITILGSGTSQGVPVIGCSCNVCQSPNKKDDRQRSSVWIKSENSSIIVDTGPDFRRQMLNASVHRIDGAIITHGHADHTVGLDDIRTYNFLQNEPLNIWAYPETHIDLLKRFSYAFGQSDYPGVPKLVQKEVSDSIFQIGDLDIQPIAVLHRKQRVLGIRINDFAYITDANSIPKDSLEKLKGIKILILNALRKENHHSHFTLSQAVGLMNDLNIERGYLTHVSHLMGMHNEVEKELPDHIKLCYDGLEIKM